MRRFQPEDFEVAGSGLRNVTPTVVLYDALGDNDIGWSCRLFSYGKIHMSVRSIFFFMAGLVILELV
ncbi:MAG: hypothetical protein LWW75_06890 [Chlorobiales bacterium]|nr:hypothetical protein [Chlorobiales bacterium]